MSTLLHSFRNTLFQSKLSINVLQLRERGKMPQPRKKNPVWFLRQNRTIHEDFITNENKNFISEVINDRFGAPALHGVQSHSESLTKWKQLQKQEWSFAEKRVGVIARKIGLVPLWKKDGTKINTTMLQIEDNHVIKYIPPEEYKPAALYGPKWKHTNKYGCLLVGAGSVDPTFFTKTYCGLFTNSGVMPKKHLARFLVSPKAELLPGTPLNVTHFRVGDYVDVRGKTVDRGFQGVMKRWGFKGMPASHGVTKTHRRPGNIGSGGAKARVWPGQKMPGHMGNRYRINRGLKIWRINTKFNVMWVSGFSIPGETNNMVYVYDTGLPLRRVNLIPPYPTNFEEPDDIATDIWSEDCHNFKDPTIFYETE